MNIYTYLISLLLTILIEAVVFKLFNSNRKIQLKKIILINLVTHPVLNFIIFVIYSYNLIQTIIYPILVLEFLVVLVEWQLLNRIYENNGTRNLVLSFAMNASSFLIGFVVF